MKRFKYILVIITLMLFVNIGKINAFSINASSSVYVNSSVAVKIEASGLTGRFDIASSNSNVLAGGDSKWIENETITVYFTAKSVGTAVITVKAVDVSNSTTGEEVTGSRSITINVVKKSVPPSINVNPTYNKNNNLSSLKIDGYELTPAFNKDILEYSVTLEPGTEKVNISAEVEDKTASIKGTGEVAVSEGVNTIEVVVTAENGNEKTYKILAEVHEKDPINVKIGEENYTVVKKKELLSRKDGYGESSVKINNFDIPALYNDVTDVTLIGLKDKDGNIKLYSYDTKTGKYAEYKEFKFDLMNLYIHENKDTEYKKINVKINDTDVVAYELDGISDYCLLYATNTTTGYEGYYLYDKIENSVQRYDTTLLENLTKEKDKYLSIVLVLSSVCFLTMLFLLVEVNRDSKRKNEE